MKPTVQASVTLYAHNLVESHKSFDVKFHIKDFNKALHWTIKRATRVVYKNPKGEEVVLK